MDWSLKKLISFDLDGTLTESKSNLTQDVAKALCQLLLKRKVAVISGAAFPQFAKQFLANLGCPEDHLKNLFIIPMNGSSMYKFEDGAWQALYEDKLSNEEKKKVMWAFEKAFKEVGFIAPERPSGELIEDRGGQITFSGLGSKAPLETKRVWDPDQEKRKPIRNALAKFLPEFEVKIGGTTSIDITRGGIDKAFGLHKLSQVLSTNESEMLYVGDALYEGGNDSSVKKLGVETIQVSGPKESIEIIENILETR